MRGAARRAARGLSELARALRREVEAALDVLGLGRRIEAVRPVGGGCINHGARLETDTGHAAFLKWNPSAAREMFAAEIDGLTALGAAGALRVPEPFGCGGGEAGAAWLLMEYVASGRAGPDWGERLGRGLAAVHASGRSGRAGVARSGIATGPHAAGVPGSGGRSEQPTPPGWPRDNWIGTLPQRNEPVASWGLFWRDRRLAPQLEAARARGLAGAPDFDRLLEAVPDALEGVEADALLHGDLWSGNAYAGPRGEPVVIDPAVYCGHGEVDLAMMELFGGFGPDCFEAYAEAAGLGHGYEAFRRDLYQLYYLLVHVVLFGRGYESGALAAARRVLSELASG